MGRKRKTLTTAEARRLGRLGGQATFAKYGREHMSKIGKAGFDAYARKLGYVGGSRLAALRNLLGKGKLQDLGGDPAEAQRWAARVLDELDPDDPKVPL